MESLLRVTSSNLVINELACVSNCLICSPIRETEGLVLGFVILKLPVGHKLEAFKVIVQLLSNQTSLILEVDRYKKERMINLKLGEVGSGYDLSEKEKRVFMELATGKSDVEIASVLSMSKSTLRVHIKNIFEKVGANSRAEAIAAYYCRLIKEMRCMK